MNITTPDRSKAKIDSGNTVMDCQVANEAESKFDPQSSFSRGIELNPGVSSSFFKGNLGDTEMRFRRTPLWKRGTDIGVSLCLIVILSPVLLLIAAYIRLRDGSPVLFKQPRLGAKGKTFVIYKFRTLKSSNQATSDHRNFVARLSTENSVTTKPDLTQRAIPGGVFLRSTSLDELPQLWNILRGDMSLIGPRPDVLQWEDYQPWQRKRFEVVPGVTGLWQVSGKNRLTFNEMIDKDIQYVENRSFWLDFTIALRTFGLILRRDNV